MLSSGPPPGEGYEFRSLPRADDAVAVESLTRLVGVFNPAEVAIAREIIEEALTKGPEVSGYRFLFADGVHGLEGYACYGPVPGTIRRFEVYWIAVHPTSQRTRLGRRLLDAVERAVRVLSGVYLMAETSSRADYAAARAFYCAQGYTQLAEIPDWHDEGDGLVIFGKRL